MLGLLVWASLSGQAVKLAFCDVAGASRTYHSDIALKGNFTAEGMDEPMALTGNVTFTMVEKVLAVKSDGTANLSNEITEGDITMNLGEQEMKYPLAGYKATFDRTPQGKVTNLKSIGDPTASVLSQMESMGFGNEWKLIAELGQRFAFPTGDVNVGDSWQSTQAEELSPGKVVTMKEQNTLKGPETVDGASYLRIDSVTSLETPEQTTKTSAAGQSIGLTMKMSMTANSKTYFDARAGQIYRTAYQGVTNMHMSVDSPAGAMVIKGTMNMNGGTKKQPNNA